MNSLKTGAKLLTVTELVRFRLSAAVTLSAVTGYFIFTARVEASLVLLITGVFLLAAGASALNQYDEKDLDILMGRTGKRPLPLGKIKPPTALAISIALITTGIGLLLFIGIIPAMLGLLNILLYNLIYTRLKRITSLAVIPGSAVGAIPPLIGFTAAGGITPKAEIVLFATFLFLWQLPHFWLILVKYRDDYQKAGFKTFSSKVSDAQIKYLVFGWIVCTTSLLVVFSVRGLVFNAYLNAVLIPVNAAFILLFYRLLFRQYSSNALRTAYIMVNAFGLLVMALFILNAFL
ncbi:MAG: protoheme IX farnesyltransferase [Bacteroidales bacterium]|nr:protoheme IX farnesyltransferase [Bacteroidales bacterium]